MEAGTQVKSLTTSCILGMRSWCPGVSLTIQQVGMLQFTENGQECRHSMVKFGLDVRVGGSSEAFRWLADDWIFSLS